MSWIVAIARWTQPDYFARAQKTNKIQLLGISFSHFCEFSYWILPLNQDYPVESHGFSPIEHVLPILKTRVGTKNGKFIPDSSSMRPSKKDSLPAASTTATAESAASVAESKSSPSEGDAKPISNKNKKSGGGGRGVTSVPIAVLPDGTVLKDSWEIAAFSGLAPIEDPELKRFLDEDLGPVTRELAYSQILKPEHRALFDQLCTEGKGWLWRVVWYLFAGSYMVKSMTTMYRVKDTDLAVERKKRALQYFKHIEDEIFPKIGVNVAEGRFIGGNSIGTIDIAIASLAAAIILPDLYCEGKYSHLFNQLQERDEKVRADVADFRSTAVGKYVMELYASHRLQNRLGATMTSSPIANEK